MNSAKLNCFALLQSKKKICINNSIILGPSLRCNLHLYAIIWFNFRCGVIIRQDDLWYSKVIIYLF